MVTRTSNTPRWIPGIFLLTGMIVIVLTLLNSTAVIQVSTTTRPVYMLHKGPSSVSPDLILEDYWTGHAGQKMNAVETYKMLLAGECAMVARYCDEYDPNKELHLCLDPVSHLVGGIYVVGNVIKNGYAGDGGDYWNKKLRQDESWPNRDGKGKFSICPDGILY